MIEQERELNIAEIADYYGVDSQIDKTIEKCAELIQALSKLKNSEYDENKGILNPIFDVIGEIADVRIMLKKLLYLLDCADDVEEAMEYKINRQLERIQEEKERKEQMNL